MGELRKTTKKMKDKFIREREICQKMIIGNLGNANLNKSNLKEMTESISLSGRAPKFEN